MLTDIQPTNAPGVPGEEVRRLKQALADADAVVIGAGAGLSTSFLRRHEGSRLLFLELGVGYNTPGIIKYPFWRMTAEDPDAVYACLNYGETYAPEEIAGKSICIDGDIGEAIESL